MNTKMMNDIKMCVRMRVNGVVGVENTKRLNTKTVKQVNHTIKQRMSMVE